MSRPSTKLRFVLDTRADDVPRAARAERCAISRQTHTTLRSRRHRFHHGPLAQNPRRVGKPLGGDVLGFYSARRGAYRVIYELPYDATVLVIRVDHRAHIYRQR